MASSLRLVTTDSPPVRGPGRFAATKRGAGLYFTRAAAGDRLVIVARTAAEAGARVAAAGFAAGGTRPYRVDESALQPYVGSFRLILAPAAAAALARLRHDVRRITVIQSSASRRTINEARRPWSNEDAARHRGNRS